MISHPIRQNASIQRSDVSISTDPRSRSAQAPVYDGAMRFAVWAVFGLAVAGCSGQIENAATQPGAPGALGGGSNAPGGRSNARDDGLIDSQGAPSEGPLACTPGDLAATTRLARLTHRQYDNAIRDLTGLDLQMSQDFLADQRQAGFDRGIDLQVGDVLEKSYRDAAEKIAEQVVDTPAAYSKVVGCQASAGQSCATSFIASFGKRALRRELTSDEKASYLALFQKGATLYDDGDDFQRGVRVTLEAMLQSPKFLYRVELSDKVSDGAIALNPYEVASRLSFLLVNTTPDAALMKAADDGELSSPDQVAAQAERLLATSDAKETVRDFHHQWLDLDVYPNKLTKDATLYPTVTPDLAPALQEEAERFVDAVTFDRKRGYASLFTAPFTFANATTAKLYGLSGSFGDELEEVQLDKTQRAGLLTQIGFLATRAFSNLSSPIHRGVFVQRRILCAKIPDPPPNVPSLPMIDGSKIKTTRQQVDMHTANEPCASCHHTLINPVGFGFENFDAVGQYREKENGVTVDATGTLAGTSENTPFSNAIEESQAIADSAEGRLCYAKNWFRYTLGREETDGDSCALSAIADRLGDDSYTALDVLEDMTRSKAFLYRAPEEP
jgi:hypothetical protein